MTWTESEYISFFDDHDIMEFEKNLVSHGAIDSDSMTFLLPKTKRTKLLVSNYENRNYDCVFEYKEKVYKLIKPKYHSHTDYMLNNIILIQLSLKFEDARSLEIREIVDLKLNRHMI